MFGAVLLASPAFHPQDLEADTGARVPATVSAIADAIHG
jgi:hypothetical protein